MQKKSKEAVQAFLDSLPPAVRESVQSLRVLQKKCDTLKSEYAQEKQLLDEKYRLLYDPVFSERAGIICGKDKENGEAGTLGAIPGFWVKVLKSMAAVRDHVNKRDEVVLKHLMDIRAENLEVGKKGFKLVFRFWPNEFFEEEVLTKSYIMGDEDGAVVERTDGCKITWKEGKNPSQKVLRKKSKGEGASDQTKVVPVSSFFDFFSPPKLPESGDEEVTVDEIAELHDLVEEDFEVGTLIREALIPNAVSWYTGDIMEEHGSEIESDEEEAMECSSSDSK